MPITANERKALLVRRGISYEAVRQAAERELGETVDHSTVSRVIAGVRSQKRPTVKGDAIKRIAAKLAGVDVDQFFSAA